MRLWYKAVPRLCSMAHGTGMLEDTMQQHIQEKRMDGAGIQTAGYVPWQHQQRKCDDYVIDCKATGTKCKVQTALPQ